MTLTFRFNRAIPQHRNVDISAVCVLRAGVIFAIFEDFMTTCLSAEVRDV